jgi:phosphohistidine phosphatase
MELILWRHADAEDEGSGGDLARELTKRGRRQSERMGAWLRARITGDWRVLSSPARRAVQTAEGLDMPFEERAALAPNASVAAILGEAQWPHGKRSVVVVGHQPTLGEVAAKLLGTREDMAFRKAAAWWFEDRDGQVVLKCVMDPDRLESK